MQRSPFWKETLQFLAQFTQRQHRNETRTDACPLHVYDAMHEEALGWDASEA